MSNVANVQHATKNTAEKPPKARRNMWPKNTLRPTGINRSTHLQPVPNTTPPAFPVPPPKKKVKQTWHKEQKLPFLGFTFKRWTSPKKSRHPASLSEIIKPYQTVSPTHQSINPQETPPAMAFGMKMVSLGPILTTLKRFGENGGKTCHLKDLQTKKWGNPHLWQKNK